ncbi:TLC domain-containing protein 5-like [Pantherophis guttatus]|uniref:TLC domain-containing protein 5-like n=1 Tax=Pantherophis guttatus TaxID=94885 RepID=A0ABM3YSU8_PANGU|nr:TLC domain-containing protein 5-like [Pantherophis guttatus]
MSPILLKVISSTLAWLLLYLGFWYQNRHRGAEWSCRIVTFLHGLMVTLLSGYVVFIDGPWPLTHTGHPNTPLQEFVLCLSLGYFIFDFCWEFLLESKNDLMLSHHLLSMGGMSLVLDTGKSGPELSAIIFVSEITNPFLQMRWFLRDSGGYDSLAGDVVDTLFVALFLGLRIVGGAWIMPSVMKSPKTYWTLKGGILAMYGVSFMFLMKIFSFSRKKINKKIQAWKNGRTRRDPTKCSQPLPNLGIQGSVEPNLQGANRSC